ncbi:PREDICTED: uncharacterized protein LOC105312682 [Amphimedon queenslandica]|uniref:JmjC domain-containing protein n=1 Tax=Amphimedon queenslandica TaxID=400682 RepID=A0AAN0IME2_AMPQE|nr:PREDICTED: uncharacterized protein LOC105312682 [Amphimedon queenslandica]|eukprot:XP_011403823.1 PREDICTED: uncharacterized protein LOC105312682 [Amphimedon queenslandica]
MASTRKRNKSTRSDKSSILKGREEIHEAKSSVISPECQIYLTLGGAFLFSCLCTALIWYVFLRERGIELENPLPGRYHYLTSDIDQLGEWAFGDVEPIDELLSPNPSRSSINVWIGQPNVIAHTHYDGYHNFYAQLYGTKKFTLLRPTQWPGLYPYPFLHPSHAQAQVNLSRLEDAKEFPLSSRLEVYEVTLEPGDLLYMPPLWFHYVESLSISISVNVWTDSEQSILMEKAFGLPLPLDQVKWHGEHLRAIAGSMLTVSLVDRVCKARECPLTDKYNINETEFKNGGQYFMFKLWQGRYSKLMKRNEIHSSFSSKNGRRNSLLCENSALPSLFFQGISQNLYKAPVEEYLTKITRLMMKLPRDSWELWFGNYVEFVAAQSVDLLDVGLFLKHYDSCSMHFPK